MFYWLSFVTLAPFSAMIVENRSDNRVETINLIFIKKAIIVVSALSGVSFIYNTVIGIVKNAVVREDVKTVFMIFDCIKDTPKFRFFW